MKIYASFPTSGQEPGRIIWPDSCWLLSDRPLYIPDFAPRFVAVAMAAYKIGRLGKCVAPRFASRYIAEYSAALVISPADVPEKIKAGQPLSFGEYCYDNAVVIGNWRHDPPQSISCQSSPLSPAAAESANPAEVEISVSAMPPADALASAIKDLSAYNTLKMGDVILLPLDLPHIPLLENLQVTLKSDDSTLVTTRFK